MVDALFDGPEIDWCHTPDAEVVESMAGAKAPFDAVDLILITHRHRDHVTPSLVLKHLDNNPRGVLVAPPQVVELLRQEDSQLARFGERIREIDLDLHASAELEINGIRLEVHRLRHGAYMVTDENSGEKYNKHVQVENDAYLVDIDGVTALHVGDAFLFENSDYLLSPRFPRRAVDLVFLDKDWGDETARLLEEKLSFGRLIFMHLRPEAAYIESVADHLAGPYPDAVLFREPMESRRFSF